jgi:hypothetical protein
VQVACNHELDEDIQTPENGGMKSLLVEKVYKLCRVKTIMTIVLMVKSSMDAHTIRNFEVWLVVV